VADLSPVPPPPKRFVAETIDGMWVAPNACSVCEKWLPPYMACLPNEVRDEYCWGHENDALIAERDALRVIVNRYANDWRPGRESDEERYGVVWIDALPEWWRENHEADTTEFADFESPLVADLLTEMEGE
jgi:hypothetical protein